METAFKWFWLIVVLVALFWLGGLFLAIGGLALVVLVNVLERVRTRPMTWEEYRPGITADVERIKAEDAAR